MLKNELNVEINIKETIKIIKDTRSIEIIIYPAFKRRINEHNYELSDFDILESTATVTSRIIEILG